MKTHELAISIYFVIGFLTVPWVMRRHKWGMRPLEALLTVLFWPLAVIEELRR
jgi:hypothetical protein